MFFSLDDLRILKICMGGSSQAQKGGGGGTSLYGLYGDVRGCAA